MLSPPRRQNAVALEVRSAAMQSPGSTRSARRMPAAADFLEVQTRRIKESLSGIMHRSASAPIVTGARLDVPRRPEAARAQSLPAASASERPGALKVDWQQAAPHLNEQLRKRYENRSTPGVLAFAARRASDADFRAFQDAFAHEPAKAVQHLIKVAADLEAPRAAVELAVSKLPATPAEREQLMDLLTSESITQNLLRNVQAHPRLVRAALKLKRAMYLRLVLTGRKPSDRRLIGPRDRIASVMALAPSPLTNAQLLLDIAFLRLNPAHRTLALNALQEIWSDHKDAVADLVADLVARLNDKLSDRFEQRTGHSVERRPIEAMRDSARNFVSGAWNEAMLIHCLTHGGETDSAYATQLAQAMRTEVQRLSNFQGFMDAHSANPTPRR